MRILYTTDIHANDRYLTQMLSLAELQKVDVLIIGGDIVPHNLADLDKKDILTAQQDYLFNTFIPEIHKFKQNNHTEIYLDMGNDDYAYNRLVLKHHDGYLFHLIHNNVIPLSSYLDIAGYMNVPPTPFSRKDWEKPDSKNLPHPKQSLVRKNGVISKNGRIEEYEIDFDSQDNIENDLKLLESKIQKPFIFVSHCPPFNTELDVIHNGIHVGSPIIRTFIEKWAKRGKMILSLHGHIHESPFITGYYKTQIEGIFCLNPGQDSDVKHVFRYLILHVEDDTETPLVTITETTEY